MPSLRMYDYGVKDQPFDPTVLPESNAWLLFPPDESHPSPGPQAVPPQTIVVLDGSWRQARRMSHRLPALATLPRFSPPPAVPPPARIRRPPFEGGMSTLEAIARAVAQLEGDRAAQQLDELYACLVQRIQDLRGYPT